MGKRLIDKDSLINILHVYYDSSMRHPGHIDHRSLFRQILVDIENEPEISISDLKDNSVYVRR